MLVRSFGLSDYASVSELLKKVLSESCYEETIEVFGRQLSWDSELVLIAEKNDDIIGVLIGTIDNNQGYYYRIAVDLDHRRTGVGSSLIQGLKKRFDQRKVSKVLVSGDAHNEPAKPLYESLGYQASDFLDSMQHLSIVQG